MKFPHLTFYVDKLPNNFAGVANGPVIRTLKYTNTNTFVNGM